MPFPGIVWSALAIIGGLLLIGDASKFKRNQKVGVMVIFGGFIFQVYWEILHQTAPVETTWNMASILGVILMSVLIVPIVLSIFPELIGKQKK
jgi:threonine/homoserine efflux transporter RhtA